MSNKKNTGSPNNFSSGTGGDPLILPVKGVWPEMGNNCFVAPNATIVGDVKMGNDCSVWFNAVLRGDVNFIHMGNKVNVQDGAVIHCTYQKTGTSIGNNVSIGHNAIVHGCVIDDNVLVGMGAIVMDNAHIGSNSIIAAGAVVLENTIVEPGTIYAGIPAKKVKDISQEKISGEIDRIANNYLMYSSWFKEPEK
ncbi:gamma carbonic anhydrase family protein [Ferruginibacter sp.]